MIQFSLRKPQAFLVLALIASLIAVPAQANSAPGEPSTITSEFTVAKDNPIVVQNEVLTFQIDPETEKEADVTADYTMCNTSGKPDTVNMLFPSVGDMLDAKVTLDGVEIEAVETQVYSLNYNGLVRNSCVMDVDDIIALYNLEKGVYKPKEFKATDTLNEFTVRAGESTVIFPEGSKIISPDSHLHTQDMNLLDIYADEPFHLYLLGGNSLTIDGATVAPDSQTTFQDMALEYKSLNLQHAGEEAATLSEQDYLNQFYMHIDRLLQQQDFLVGSELEPNGVTEFTVLCYQAGFPAGAVRDVKVSYHIKAGYPSGYENRTEKSEYDYLLNPGKYWAGFKQLKIVVIPGPHRNVMTYSTLPLKRQWDGSYKGVFHSLPDSDLIFDLGALPMIWLVFGIMAAAAVVLTLTLVLALLLLRRRRAKQAS